MSLVINNNLMAYGAGNNLNSHYASMNKSVQRLSSGLRVMGASDDAAGLAIREIMRSEISTLQQGIRNANDAISLIQTADGALGVIDEKLIRMKELAEQASTGTYDDVQRGIIDDEYQAMASEITRISNATDFNGIKLLDGTLSGKHDGSQTTSTGGVKIHFGTGNDSAEDYYFIEIGDSTASSLGVGNQVGVDYGSDQVADNSDLAETGTGGTGAVGSGDEANLGDIWEVPDGLESWSSSQTVKVETPDSPAVYEAGEFAGVKMLLGGTIETYPVADPPVYIDGGLSSAGTVTAEQMAAAYTEHMKSSANAGDSPADFIRLAEDTLGLRPGVLGTWTGENNGINPQTNLPFATAADFTDGEVPLEGTPPVKPGGTKPDGTVHAGPTTIPGTGDLKDILEAGISASHADEIPGHSIRTQENAQKALTALDAAIVQKDKTRANLGSVQNRLENTVSNLTIQRQNIQASESRISDVDVTTEMTNFVRNQTLTQAALGMLSQANSMPQMATKLIG